MSGSSLSLPDGLESYAKIGTGGSERPLLCSADERIACPRLLPFGARAGLFPLHRAILDFVT